jgi:hypothetical protein
MELKQFLQSAFNKQEFIKFISERFYGFAPNLQESEYLGKVKLDDRSEIGFFVRRDEKQSNHLSNIAAQRNQKLFITLKICGDSLLILTTT